MTNRFVSFSSDFKGQYGELNKPERDRIDAALTSLIPILKAMKAHDFHFQRNAVRFAVGGTLGILHVSIYDNPLRAVVKKLARK